MNFLQLRSDSNVMRILGQPYQYYCHPEYKYFFSHDYDQRLKCAALSDEKCSLCVSGSPARARWIISAISRRSQEVVLLDINRSIFSMLQKLFRSSSWGNLENYDVDIRGCTDGNCLNDICIYPKPPTPLSNFDRKLKNDFVNLKFMVNLTLPPMGIPGAYESVASYKPEVDQYNDY